MKNTLANKGTFIAFIFMMTSSTGCHFKQFTSVATFGRQNFEYDCDKCVSVGLEIAIIASTLYGIGFNGRLGIGEL
jgi:hypothetical protein